MNCGIGISEARRRSWRKSVVRLEFSSMGIGGGTAVHVKRCAVGRLTTMLSVWVLGSSDSRSLGALKFGLVAVSSEGELITDTTSL